MVETSIYWERCPICGRYIATFFCKSLKMNTCIYCCLAYSKNPEEALSILKGITE